MYFWISLFNKNVLFFPPPLGKPRKVKSKDSTPKKSRMNHMQSDTENATLDTFIISPKTQANAK